MICKICNKEFKNVISLSNHISRTHFKKIKDYYNQFLKKENDGICYCGKETIFDNITKGYRKYCSYKCMANSSEVKEKRKQTSYEHFGSNNPMQSEKGKKLQILGVQKSLGVDHPSQSKKVQEKRKLTNEERFGGPSSFSSKDVHEKGKITSQKNFGTNNPMQSEKGKKLQIQGVRKSLGVDHPSQCKKVQEKFEKTCKKRFGGSSPYFSKEIREKGIITSREHFGTDNPMQCSEIFEKNRKSCFRRKEYILPSGKLVFLQGYEPDLTKYIFSNNLLKEEEIEFHPKPFIYYGNEKKHYYFPDLYIIPFDLYIEVKDSYILSLEKYMNEKIKSVKFTGHKFLMILDKKYGEFQNLINQLKQYQNLTGVLV
jgi:hypothetical protein